AWCLLSCSIGRTHEQSAGVDREFRGIMRVVLVPPVPRIIACHTPHRAHTAGHVSALQGVRKDRGRRATMVLQELGSKLTSALRRLNTDTVVDKETIKAVVGDICRALLESDVNVQMVMKLRKNVESKAETLLGEQQDGGGGGAGAAQQRRSIQKAVVDELTGMLDPKTAPYKMKKGKSNVVMFVGLQGAGKTTTIAKFAHYWQRKGWKVAMVCADTFRAGAFDQLKQNATKLRCPFYGSYTEADPVRIADEGVQQFKQEKYEVIIVDTSGRHKQEEALFDEMKEIQEAVAPDNTTLIMDATQGQAVFDQAKAFHAEAVAVGSVIITKLDGHAKGGGALSAVAATNSPITFLGGGEHFDDLEAFDAHSFVSRLLGFGDMKGLMQQIQESQEGSGDPKEMMERMSKGKFTLRDLYKQLSSAMKMGPMGKVMGMIPGMGDMAQMANSSGMQNMFKKNLYMMDSMTDDELDGKVDLSQCESRLLRIARGSGTHPDEVRGLLKLHKHFEKVVGKVGKNMKGDATKAKQLQRNPALAKQHLNQMDPKVIESLGGRQKVLDMIKNGGPGGGGAGGGQDAQAAAMAAMLGGGGLP
ncbi:unnamed protein product, partial [Scytosiphon promiscuus]